MVGHRRLRRPARPHDAAPLPRRRPDRHAGHPADRPAPGPRRRGHDARQLGHLLSHALLRARPLESRPRPRRAHRRAPGSVRAARRGDPQRRRGPGAGGGRERRGRTARGRAPGVVWRLPAPQRPRLRRLGGVRVRLPHGGQAARRHHLPAARMGGWGDDVDGRAGHALSCARSPPARRRSAHGGQWHPARRMRPRDRRLRRGPHAAAAAREPRRDGLGRTGPQPLDPPRDRCARAVRRADRSLERRSPELLRRRARRRGRDARG